ncbi:SPFH domain-containing protein [Burkholderia ubonensis]|uniref:SPFH domain-containing protein n=1 Tax=Burkholderia ubonensis TaxID=101571 RepID=UPI00075BCBF3|nr:SPFH domain-containing protein [Burkholderia ubonensis]KVP17331.1 hypothetical protein WJ84_03620 [Burkholderia ubonensis]KVP39548.1 hypothetical protein WJ87_04745 [Burkholderia ubonensis]
MSLIASFLISVVAVFGVVGLLMAVMLRRVVPTNMVHIVQTTRSSTPYGRGKPAGNTYYAWPSWVPKLGITVTEFPESIFQVSLSDYEAYDQARLPFIIDTTAFFRIDNAETAAQRVATFQELKNDLQAVLQGAVRRVLATNALENIMQSRSELGDQFTTEVKEQIAEWGVLPVKTIEFMDLRDAKGSTVIANVMAKEKSRIEKESRVAVADNQRQAELAEIDAQRTVEVQRQDAAQQVGLRTAEKDKAVGIANEQAQQDIKAAAKTTAERDMDVKKVQDVRSAEIQRDVATVRAEQDKQVAVVNAEAQKQVQVVSAEAAQRVQVLNAEATKQATTTKAEGDLAAALKDAEGIRARGEASAAAEQAMLMAPVVTQIKLAEEIGSNPGYQQYLVTIKQVEAGRDVGLEMARAMQHADLKVIANAGDMQQGVAKLGDIFTPAGGTKLTGMLAALGQTEDGKKLIDSLVPMLTNGATAGALVGAATGNATAGAVAGEAAAA